MNSSNILFVVALLGMSALFSGLTLGMFSLSLYELKRKAELGNKKAARIYPIRKKGNQLLVALLTGNVAVNALLSVFLGSLTSGLIATIASTVLITLFGEIVPQAVFTRFALNLSYKLAWLLNLILIVSWPIAVPLAKLLDAIIGPERQTIMSKAELVKIFEEHEASKDSNVDEDELQIVTNALAFGDMKVSDVMTPRIATKMLDAEQPITKKLISELYESGFSRFPVYSESQDNIVGLLYIRDLLKLNRASKPKVENYQSKSAVIKIQETDNLDDALNKFIKTKNHMFIVVNQFNEFGGVVTLEDVLEQIIGREFVDEFDKVEDTRKVV